MRTQTFRASAAVTTAAAVCLALAGCSTAQDDGVTELNFFQFKGEAIAEFDQIIEGFEAENPDIRVVQDQVADSETAIRTLLVKNRPPDVITLNGNGSNGALAAAGVFHDFSDDPVLQTINPAVQDILAELGHVDGEVNALGYVNNADGIIYNREIFAEHGIEVPQTFDELLAACETLQAAGVTPFAASISESWTTMPSFNALGVYPALDGFFDKMREEGENVGPDSPVSFQKDYAPVIEQQLALYQYAQSGARGASYDDANALFARGEAAMMMQGIWAMNPVQLINPDIDAAIFPYPSPEGPEHSLLVSGVDVMVTLPKDGEHHEEAMRFVEYMFRPDVIETFAESQNMFPSVTDAKISDTPLMQSVAPLIEEGRITGFIDHQVPPSIPLPNLVQQAIYEGSPGAALSTLDREWAKVAARTIPVETEN